LYARVGGAGGSSDSDGGGEGLGAIVWLILSMIPFPYNIIVLVAIIILFWYINKKMKQKTILNKLPAGDTPKTSEGYQTFLVNNPGFNETAFKEKVKTAFMKIQEAWANKDMSKVRQFISDGMYQRLNIQFKMMDLLSQKNTIEKLEIQNLYIDKVQSDGSYDVIHVGIGANVVDKFISDKYPELNSGGSETFVEYWSFIKKRGTAEGNIFSSLNCPKCGAELPKKASDMAKCEYCGTIMNSGEFDWVLCEITQADDYISSDPALIKAANLREKVLDLVEDNDDFTVAMLEDKASNGYLQIETARVYKKPELMRRFVSDEAFAKFTGQFEKQEPFIYNRIFLNDVTLIGVMQKDNKNILMIAVKYSYQRVVQKDKKIIKLDEMVVTKTDVVLMARDITAAKNKGSVYAHSCPACGGPIGDTIDLKCRYCGAEVNSTANEWIITDVMGINQYYVYYSTNASQFIAGADPERLDKLYDVRDYAFNNVLIVAAADGVFEQQEVEFAERIAKKWGYSVDKIQPMFQMAQNGGLTLRMPEDKKKRLRIYKLMEKAASIDGKIEESEQKLLDFVKQKYLQ
jgi:hypothetical protein